MRPNSEEKEPHIDIQTVTNDRNPKEKNKSKGVGGGVYRIYSHRRRILYFQNNMV